MLFMFSMQKNAMERFKSVSKHDQVLRFVQAMTLLDNLGTRSTKLYQQAPRCLKNFSEVKHENLVLVPAGTHDFRGRN